MMLYPLKNHFYNFSHSAHSHDDKKYFKGQALNDKLFMMKTSLTNFFCQLEKMKFNRPHRI